jgi:catechol 2,3-dioxygenase
MKVHELGHVVLYVRDLERSAHFYRDVLGFHELGRQDGMMAVYSSGRTHHELLLIEVGPQAPNPPRGGRVGLYHIGLKIGNSLDELRQAKAELEAAGVPILGISDHTVSQSIYLADPDGNEIEVFVFADPTIWKDNPLSVVAPTKALRL